MSHARPRRRIALIALSVVLALVLTSCFGEDENGEESTTTTAQAAPQPAPATQAPPPPEPVPVTVAPTPPEPVPETVAPPPPEPPQPPPAAPEPPAVGEDGILLYTVQAGDTLFSIAQRFGVSLDDVVEANNIENPDVIYEGQTLTIPPAG